MVTSIRNPVLMEKRAMWGGALGRQRQGDFCELKASLVYTVSSRPSTGYSPCLQIHRYRSRLGRDIGIELLTLRVTGVQVREG